MSRRHRSTTLQMPPALSMAGASAVQLAEDLAALGADLVIDIEMVCQLAAWGVVVVHDEKGNPGLRVPEEHVEAVQRIFVVGRR